MAAAVESDTGSLRFFWLAVLGSAFIAVLFGAPGGAAALTISATLAWHRRERRAACNILTILAATATLAAVVQVIDPILGEQRLRCTAAGVLTDCDNSE
jgi:hypothetical protein